MSSQPQMERPLRYQRIFTILSFLLCMALLSCWQWCFQVNNTDAEGRLTLADALVYACNQGVDKVLRLFLFFY